MSLKCVFSWLIVVNVVGMATLRDRLALRYYCVTEESKIVGNRRVCGEHEELILGIFSDL